MNSFLKTGPVTKISQAMGRCILLGVGGVVLTFLIWRSILFYVGEIPFSFHLTCALVEAVILLATGTALYRLSKPSQNRLTAKAKKIGLISPRSKKAPLVMPLYYGKNEMAWFERN